MSITYSFNEWKVKTIRNKVLLHIGTETKLKPQDGAGISFSIKSEWKLTQVIFSNHMQSRQLIRYLEIRHVIKVLNKYSQTFSK